MNNNARRAAGRWKWRAARCSGGKSRDGRLLRYAGRLAPVRRPAAEAVRNRVGRLVERPSDRKQVRGRGRGGSAGGGRGRGERRERRHGTAEPVRDEVDDRDGTAVSRPTSETRSRCVALEQENLTVNREAVETNAQFTPPARHDKTVQSVSCGN